jgi:MFS family permease
MLLNEREKKSASTGIPHRRWLIAFLLAFGVLVNYFDRVNLSVAKQGLEHDFGISNVMFGYLLSAYNWTYAALQLPMGVLLDRFGVQAIGRISAILWSVACFAGAFSPGVKAFFGSRLLLGVGEVFHRDRHAANRNNSDPLWMAIQFCNDRRCQLCVFPRVLFPLPQPQR